MNKKPHGHQTSLMGGFEDLWCAIALTEHGKIPGKAKGDFCWYGYYG